MKSRLNANQANPQAYQAMQQLEKFVRESGLDHKLLELIKIRASQLNGCAFCIDLHTRDARKAGETEQRIYLLNAWKESTVYSDAERAALALTEAVTLISKQGVPNELYEQVRVQYSEAEYVLLVMAINTINSWNRIAISAGYTAPASF